MRCLYKRLPAAWPGTIATPCWPPLNAVSRLRRSRLAIAGAFPWHCAQFLARMGATSLGKETFLGAVCADAIVQVSKLATVQTDCLPSRSVIAAPPSGTLISLSHLNGSDGRAALRRGTAG